MILQCVQFTTLCQLCSQRRQALHLSAAQDALLLFGQLLPLILQRFQLPTRFLAGRLPQCVAPRQLPAPTTGRQFVQQLLRRYEREPLQRFFE